MTKYNEDNIIRHAGLAGIRAKPAVYIGPPDNDGLFTILREPCDNAADLALKGMNNLVHIIIDEKGYWIIDNGPGFPVGVKTFIDEKGRKEKLSTFYVATGLTHAGSNFESDQISRGTHGLGQKCTNALSNVFKIWTFRDNKWHSIEYKKGKLTQDVKKVSPPKLPHGFKAKRGSVVYFEPDYSIFKKGSKLQVSDVKQWCKLTSILIPKFEVKITHKGKTETYKSKGLSDYLDSILEENKYTSLGRNFTLNAVSVDVALSFANAEDYSVNAYTNGLHNRDGGEHVKAVIAALVQTLKPYKGKKDVYKPSDLTEGLVGIVNAKLAAPAFNTQRKDQLIDDRIYEPVFNQVSKALEEFWKKNKSLAKAIIKRAVELRSKTADFLKDKKLIANVNKQKKTLSAKLADVRSTDRDKCEIFICEGDSAGGSSKMARDKTYQAVLPLRGKPLNVMEISKDKVNANEEFATLLAAIGVDGKKNNLRYGKVIIMADADKDGEHISVLLLTFLYKYVPSLIKEGKVFIVNSPLFIARHKNNTYYGFTKKEIYKQAGSKNVDITYLKGLGECNASDLKHFAMNPKTRNIFKVSWPSSKGSLKEFENLMGKNSDFRKKLLNVA